MKDENLFCHPHWILGGACKALNAYFLMLSCDSEIARVSPDWGRTRRGRSAGGGFPRSSVPGFTHSSSKVQTLLLPVGGAAGPHSAVGGGS